VGRPPYWVASRLVTLATDHWPEVDGYLLNQGVDWLDSFCRQPSRALSQLYSFFTAGYVDPKEKEQFDLDLNEPPDDAPEDADAAMFLAAASGGIPGVRTTL
jgi:hypothetical protein